MSGVYIRDMEMPKTCYDCIFWSGYLECTLTGMDSSSKEKFCPLIPAADVQPVRRGRWKGGHERGSFSHPDSITYKCSECGYSIYTIYGFPYLPKYCSNCGAKMEVDE